MIRSLILLVCPLFCTHSVPQDPTRPPAPAEKAAPAARAADVGTVEAIVAALYDVISGPAGQARDWDRFHSLFHAKAQLIPMVAHAGGTQAAHLTPQQYRERSGWLEESGFFEQEIARKTDRFGDIAQVFSTYEARRAPGEKPFLRGINSIQVCREKDRWWVLSVLWQQEHDAGPIPAQYLPK